MNGPPTRRSPASPAGPATYNNIVAVIVAPGTDTERWHAQTEYEAGSAYWLGLRDGVRLAAGVYGRVIDDALRRPEGPGGPELDELAQATVRDLYRRYLGVPAVTS